MLKIDLKNIRFVTTIGSCLLKYPFNDKIIQKGLIKRLFPLIHRFYCETNDRSYFDENLFRYVLENCMILCKDLTYLMQASAIYFLEKYFFLRII